MNKLYKKSEGSLQIAVGIDEDHIIIEFANPSSWIGLDYSTAIGLADAITEHAKNIKNKGHYHGSSKGN